VTEAGVEVALADPAATEGLGRAMAAALLAGDPLQAVLLRGPLGAGKTTLVRALVSALPGGEDARVASPSFNLMNIYPTRPETAHFDLYRLAGIGLGEDLSELLHEGGRLVLVEWPEHLAEAERPPDFVLLEIEPEGAGRRALLSARGSAASAYLRLLHRQLTKGSAQAEGSGG